MIKTNPVYFYSLSDPITDEVCYIGQTTNPALRQKNHCDLRSHHNLHKFFWLTAMAGKGLTSKFKIIFESSEMEVVCNKKKIEIELIETYWIQGHPLLNKQGNKKHREYDDRIKSSKIYQVYQWQFLD